MGMFDEITFDLTLPFDADLEGCTLKGVKFQTKGLCQQLKTYRVCPIGQLWLKGFYGWTRVHHTGNLEVDANLGVEDSTVSKLGYIRIAGKFNVDLVSVSLLEYRAPTFKPRWMTHSLRDIMRSPYKNLEK